MLCSSHLCNLLIAESDIARRQWQQYGLVDSSQRSIAKNKHEDQYLVNKNPFITGENSDDQ